MDSAAGPLESGQEYVITLVNGRQPDSLDDFDGDLQLTLVRPGQQLEVVGAVARTPEAVRFYQKDLALPDRDIRVWTITERADSTFLAAPLPDY